MLEFDGQGQGHLKNHILPQQLNNSQADYDKV